MKTNQVTEVPEQIVHKMVLCRGVKFGISVPLQECLKCEFSGGYQQFEVQNNLPPNEQIKCTIPNVIRVTYFVEGITTKGKDPIKENEGV